MARKNKKSKSREADDEDDDNSPAEPAKPKVRMDAYVGMTALTFLALVASATLLYLDFESLNAQTVQPPSVSVPSLGAVLLVGAEPPAGTTPTPPPAPTP